ncbi:MAG: FKBP-type peptidyl-prolyl cis-trans isomerase [Flavobacteriales bacterium]|nr:FKBP-type peptidyl-prolyl cis-trans isomerase [Flavobacteriales bacterium]
MIRVLSSLLLILFILSCKQRPLKGFTKISDQTGYRLITDLDTGVASGKGVFMLGYAQIRNEYDSLINDPFLREGFYLQVPLNTADSSDFIKALKKLTSGDSAIIKMQANAFFSLPSFRQPLPANVDSGSFIKIHIRIDQLMDNDLYVTWLDEKENHERAYAYKQFQDYLRLNNIEGEPVGSGIYMITEIPGKGKSPKYGSEVTIHLMGITFSGQEITNTYPSGQPWTFVLGSGAVPQGLDEGISRMHKGEKCRIIVPYYLAYGKEGMPPLIPPYTHMVYVVELLNF